MKPQGDILYLSRSDIDNLEIPMSEVIRVVEEAFLERAKGRVESPPKPGIHPQRDSFIHAMPAYIHIMNSAGIKWVSGFPENCKRGLPYISGLLILNDPQTGIPICVMDCTWITAKRTGAATSIAAKYMARKDSKTLGILGCGVQGRSNLEALAVTCGNLEKVKAYDISRAQLRNYVNDMTATYGLEITPVDSSKAAVEDCDIVVTAGPILKHPKPEIKASWFKEGGFACPLDFDSYWKSEATHSMDKIYTDDKEQLDHYKSLGYFSDFPAIYAELADVVSQKKRGRENSDERIMSMNLGLALEDMATAILIYEKAMAEGTGTNLPL